MILIKKIYFAHPFSSIGTLEDNVKAVEKYVINAINKDRTIIPVSPLHATGFLFPYYTYEDGMEICYAYLKDCDFLCLCGDWEKSRGVKLEIEFAKANDISIKEYDELFQ